LFGSMMRNAQRVISFREWFEKQGKPFLNYLEELYEEKELGFVDISREDMEFLHRHFKEGYIQKYRELHGI